MLKFDKKCYKKLFKKILKNPFFLLYKFFSTCYNMRVIKRNAQRFRLVTLNSSSFSPLSYMDWAQNRKALRLIHFSAFARVPRGGARPAFPRQGNAAPAVLRAGRRTGWGACRAGGKCAEFKKGAGRQVCRPAPFLYIITIISRKLPARPLRSRLRPCSSNRRRFFSRIRR